MHSHNILEETDPFLLFCLVYVCVRERACEDPDNRFPWEPRIKTFFYLPHNKLRASFDWSSVCQMSLQSATSNTNAVAVSGLKAAGCCSKCRIFLSGKSNLFGLVARKKQRLLILPFFFNYTSWWLHRCLIWWSVHEEQPGQWGFVIFQFVCLLTDRQNWLL